jgi:hypothetical protein
MLFHDLLKTQLILKGVIAPEDWDQMKEKIYFNFLQDGYFAELKNSEMMRERVGLARDLEQYVGKYFSHKYIRTKILKQNEKEVDDINNEISAENEETRISDEMKANREKLKSFTGGDTPEQEEEGKE